MAVRHQGGPFGAAGDILELRERLRLVRAKDCWTCDQSSSP
jgi:hypothetical protein